MATFLLRIGCATETILNIYEYGSVSIIQILIMANSPQLEINQV